jgi:hypothetical protein
MPFTEDFSNSADRYWLDANTLSHEDRLGTADHLFGISAESALKAIMVALSGGTKLPRRYKIHLPKIWDEFIAYMPSTGTHPYAVALTSNAFLNWDLSDRYGHDTHFTRARVDNHRNASLQANIALEHARLDGVLI